MPDKVTFLDPPTGSDKKAHSKIGSKVSYTWLENYYITVKNTMLSGSIFLRLMKMLSLDTNCL